MARKQEFVSIKSPFADLSPEERVKALQEIGQNANRIYNETKARLDELLASADTVDILARIGWRFFAIQASPPSKEHQPAANQHHVELIHALSLRLYRRTPTSSIRLADTVQQVLEALDANAAAFNLRRLGSTSLSDSDDGRLQAIQEQIRGDTQFVRGEFHPHQLDRYLRAILHDIDDDFSRVFGLTGTAVLSILQGLLRLVERKLNTHRKLVGRVARISKPSKALKQYLAAFPQEQPRRDEILADSIAQNVSPEMMRWFLMEQADRFLPGALSFNLKEIESVSDGNARQELIKHVFDQWSFSFGDLQDTTVEHLYLANPVWDRPFIKLGEDQYFWPCPGSSMSFGFEMFERLITSDARLLKAYESARASVLEAELTKLLTRYFPAGRILGGLKWVRLDDGRRYENDAVVLIDRCALLFEAKSGKVSAAARRWRQPSIDARC